MTRPKPCRKVRYRDLLAAKVALMRAQERHDGQDKVEARAYYHRPCRAWHLTSMRG